MIRWVSSAAFGFGFGDACEPVSTSGSRNQPVFGSSSPGGVHATGDSAVPQVVHLPCSVWPGQPGFWHFAIESPYWSRYFGAGGVAASPVREPTHVS